MNQFYTDSLANGDPACVTAVFCFCKQKTAEIRNHRTNQQLNAVKDNNKTTHLSVPFRCRIYSKEKGDGFFRKNA